MDPTSLNTIVGIIGIISTFIGIVIGTIGAINIHNSKKIIKNMTIRNNTGNVQLAEQINNGPSVEDIEYLARKMDREHLRIVTKIEDIDELIKSNPRYCVPLIWSGTQEEYDEMKNRRETLSNALYCIVNDG